VIVSNKHPKLVPKLPRVPDEQARPVDENLGVDDVLGEEIEELEELVVGVLVLDVLLNFIERRRVGGVEVAAVVVVGAAAGAGSAVAAGKDDGRRKDSRRREESRPCGDASTSWADAQAGQKI
jgi:hypothetical protein